MRTLDRAFVRTARRFPLRFMMADGKTPKVHFGSALTKTIYIARRLRHQIGERPMIGLLLPPSVGGALTNYALTLLGRVPVNLNYTSSSEVIASCATQCESDVVITSKAFVERFPNLEIPGRTLFLEDVLQSPAFARRCCARAGLARSCSAAAAALGQLVQDPQPGNDGALHRSLTESTTSPPSSSPAAAPAIPRA